MLGPRNMEALWELPVHQMFMVNNRIARHFFHMGLTKIGDIARLDQMAFRRRMRYEMGKQSDIQSDYYWQIARGIDPSPVESRIRRKLKSISNGKMLRASLYQKLEDIQVVLLELVVEVVGGRGDTALWDERCLLGLRRRTGKGIGDLGGK